MVAVIDTGIDVGHPAFDGRISAKSYNSRTNQIGLNYVQDDDGHGTHVSGIVAAMYADDDISLYGVAPDAEILMIKANFKEGDRSFFATDSLLRAINYAVENGADVINMSLGRSYYNGGDALEEQTIANAVKNGVTVICAAGNNSEDHVGYPAAYPEAIAVSATKIGNGFDYSYSNHGPEVDVAAPGSDILSAALGGGAVSLSGTSMASPCVAGVAALIKALHPAYTPQEVRTVLRETARDAGELGNDELFGAGVVSAYAAVLGPDALCKVTYAFNDNNRAPVIVKAAPGSKLLLPYEPAFGDLVLSGWFIDETETAFNFASDTVQGDMQLRAQWTALQTGMYAAEFPDANFLRHVLLMLSDVGINRTAGSMVSANDKATLAEFTSLNVSGMDIADLTGLQYFSDLWFLWCDNNRLSTLDVSGNSKLVTLWCEGNQLTTLDVSNNAALWELCCSYNALTTLDVSKNGQLRDFMCRYNQLTTLDLSKNTKLEGLWCQGNQFATLDVSNNRALAILNCSENELTKLDVSNNASLWIFWCKLNQLKSLDLSHNPGVVDVGCAQNQLTALDVSKNPELKYLQCQDNQLAALEVPKNVESLQCQNNQLAALDLSNCFKLLSVDCGCNQIRTLNIAKATELLDLWCYDNQLTALDLSKNAALVSLDCDGNQLAALDLSNNPALEWVYCYQNALQNLDVSKCKNLERLICSENQLTALDVSKNTALLLLDCGENQLSALDVSKNTMLSTLRCAWNELRALNVSHNTSLTELYCANNQLSTLDVSKNIMLEWLACEENQLTMLDVSKSTSLAILNCSTNQLNALDLSKSTALQALYCGYNNLPSLDLSKNPMLQWLFCGSNQLTALDLSKNTELRSLDCSENQMTALNVTKQALLEDLRCGWNQLDTLDVSNNPQLSFLECTDNRLTALDLSKNPMLQWLNCGSNQLTSLDISTHGDLKELWCYNNQLTTLDVSHNAALEKLECSVNQLTGLDLSNNPLLTFLSCGGNRLTALDLSKNPMLQWLFCGSNQLTALDISNNRLLEDLDCFNNNLRTLDLSNNTALTHLDCTQNEMQSTDDVKGWQTLGLILEDSFLFSPQKGVQEEPVMTIITQPEATTTVPQGDGTYQLQIEASATEDVELQYQWYVNTTAQNSGGTPIAGATDATFTIPDTLTPGTYYYYCVVSAEGPWSVASNVATVVVTEVAGSDITITTQPAASTTVPEGDATRTLNIEATAPAGTALQYQWYVNAAAQNSGGTAVASATSTTFTIPGTLTPGTYYYYCVVSAEGLQSVTSSVATVVVTGQVIPVISIITQPAAATTVTEGDAAAKLDIDASVTEGASLQYQWYSNTTAQTSGGTAIAGATSKTFAIPGTLTPGTYYYYCIVSAQGAQSVTSNVATVTVAGKSAPVISIITQPKTTSTVPQGDTTHTLEIKANVTLDAALQYQWYSNTTAQNTGGTKIDGATSATFAIPGTLTPGTYYYYCVVSAAGAQSVTSTVAAVEIQADNRTVYAVLGHFGSFTGSGDCTGKINASSVKFVQLLLNNKDVAASNYTVVEGSTVIMLKESYLKTLANGNYTLRAEFTDGYADLTLTVNVPGKTAPNNPRTGDDGNLIVWMEIGAVSVLSMVCVAALKKRRQSMETR